MNYFIYTSQLVVCRLQLRFVVGNFSAQSTFGGSIAEIDPALAAKLLLVEGLKESELGVGNFSFCAEDFFAELSGKNKTGQETTNDSSVTAVGGAVMNLQAK